MLALVVATVCGGDGLRRGADAGGAHAVATVWGGRLPGRGDMEGSACAVDRLQGERLRGDPLHWGADAGGSACGGDLSRCTLCANP
jgi:hypothetical protein